MKSWPSLERYARSLELQINGLRLHLYDAGDSESPVAVLLHGLGDESDTWHYLIEPLSAHCRVLAPDLPGFGRSQKPRFNYTIPFICQCLLELLDVLGISSANWIGNSLGALLAQTIALEHPQRLTSLVLIGGSLLVRRQPISMQNLLFLIPGIGEWLYNRLRKDPQAAFDTLRPYYHDLDGLPKEDRDFLFERVNQRVWDDDQRYAYFSVLRNLASFTIKQQRGLKQRLKALEFPTLVVWGADDQIIPQENAHALVEVQSNARLVILPETGHNLQQERPQELLDAILADERLKIGR